MAAAVTISAIPLILTSAFPTRARKRPALLAEKEVGTGLCHEIKRNYVSASDLTWTVSRVLEAVASGRLKPKTARTLAYLAQIMAQTIPLAQHEFVESVGRKRWAIAVSESFPTQGNPRYDDDPGDDEEDDESGARSDQESPEQTPSACKPTNTKNLSS